MRNFDSSGVEMSFWKILGYSVGGAVVGVGAIAAAPFTGGGSVLGAVTLLSSLTGAGTVAAAVGAGAVGAAAGAALADSEESVRKDGYAEGQKDAKAEYSKYTGELEVKLGKAFNMLKENEDYFNAIYAMVAVGVACASCEGKISSVERDEIEQFINGLSSTKLPDHVKEKIQSLYEKPLNIREAFEIAKNSNLEWSLFDDIINLVIHTDKRNKDVFVQAWKKLRSA
jgi:uncharacterized membrane protein YebE (DUF533 family)